jgi:hypothetical protein
MQEKHPEYESHCMLAEAYMTLHEPDKAALAYEVSTLLRCGKQDHGGTVPQEVSKRCLAGCMCMCMQQLAEANIPGDISLSRLLQLRNHPTSWTLGGRNEALSCTGTR